MDAFMAAMEKMEAETAAGTAVYHFEDDGEEYTVIRNGVAVAGISHGMADAIPGLKAAIEACWEGSDKPN